MTEFPKGMNIPVDNTEDFFTQSNTTKENLKLKDVNYVKMIIDKLNEINDINIDIENITVNEDYNGSNLLLNLKVSKEVLFNGK